jgi:chromosomal replication initiation ATPase DnaA
MDETQILDGVAATFGITREQLLSRSKYGRFSEARKVAYYLLRKSDYSTTEVGEIMHRDHSTVIVGSQKVEARMEASTPYALTIQRLRAGLWEERGCLA